MDDDDPRRVIISRAIALATASHAQPDSPQLVLHMVAEYVREGVPEPDILVGLLNLSTLLLLRLEEAGRDPLEELQEIARDFGQR